MTLNQWVKNGCPMLSDYAAGWCCQVVGIVPRQLRQMELHDIFQIPGAGEVARREVDRWARNNPENRTVQKYISHSRTKGG